MIVDSYLYSIMSLSKLFLIQPKISTQIMPVIDDSCLGQQGKNLSFRLSSLAITTQFTGLLVNHSKMFTG